MNMANKIISISIPEEMLPVIDSAARKEYRSRSELIREVLRRYLSGNRGGVIPVDDAQADEIEAIRAGRQELARGEFVRLEDLQHDSGLTTQ
jgi:metal-responsive CopG/Arc/MetJ family transcriptional regulator